MERKLIITGDGSHSISITEMPSHAGTDGTVTYHSIHGAIQESMHVFIEAGFRYVINCSTTKQLNLLEIGFGTGLNALLTLMEAQGTGMNIYYEALEPYPLNEEEVKSLNYCLQLNRPDLREIFERMHNCEWDKEVAIIDNFTLSKKNIKLLNFSTHQLFNLIYFDAFAPAVQPELWTKEVFDKLYGMMAANGILVTYCSKSDVRRAMQAAGFSVEKIPGPPHKREMLRAVKSL